MSNPWVAGQINVLANLAQSLLSVEQLITGAAYLIGLVFAIKAVYSLKAHGESRSSGGNSSITEPLVYFLVAGMLIYLPTGLEVLLSTAFGGNGSIVAYAPINSQAPLLSAVFGSDSEFGMYLETIIQVIGIIAFVRGWILLARSASHGQQPGGTGRGLTHIIGGVLAINIVGTLQVLNNTLYGTA